MQQEVSILRTLDHPNILKIHETYQDKFSYFIVTELCTGGELFDRITSSQSICEATAAEYTRQILSCLVYCHDRNVVHRDLKPENFLLDTAAPSANIKLIDFGAACELTPGNLLTRKVGTSYYIAPEVIEMGYTEKCDIWSAGTVLYVMLSGVPPFSGNSDEEIIRNVSKGKYAFAGREWEGISAHAKDFISKLMNVDPSARLSAKQALNHPWITNAPKQGKTLFFSLFALFWCNCRDALSKQFFCIHVRPTALKFFAILGEELGTEFEDGFSGQYARHQGNQLLLFLDQSHLHVAAIQFHRAAQFLLPGETLLQGEIQLMRQRLKKQVQEPLLADALAKFREAPESTEEEEEEEDEEEEDDEEDEEEEGEVGGWAGGGGGEGLLAGQLYVEAAILPAPNAASSTGGGRTSLLEGFPSCISFFCAFLCVCVCATRHVWCPVTSRLVPSLLFVLFACAFLFLCSVYNA